MIEIISGPAGSLQCIKPCGGASICEHGRHGHACGDCGTMVKAKEQVREAQRKQAINALEFFPLNRSHADTLLL